MCSPVFNNAIETHKVGTTKAWMLGCDNYAVRRAAPDTFQILHPKTDTAALLSLEQFIDVLSGATGINELQFV